MKTLDDVVKELRVVGERQWRSETEVRAGFDAIVRILKGALALPDLTDAEMDILREALMEAFDAIEPDYA